MLLLVNQWAIHLQKTKEFPFVVPLAESEQDSIPKRSEEDAFVGESLGDGHSKPKQLHLCFP